jgi:hypothetical protein
MNKYLDVILTAGCFAVALYLFLVAIGAALKTVQWIGKRLGVKPFVT